MKGFFFTLDAFVALLLALILASFLLTFTSAPASFSKSLEQTYFYAEDSANVLSNARMGGYWNSATVPVPADEGDRNNTLLLQIGKYAERGQLPYAQALVSSALDNAIPIRYGYSVQYLKRDGTWLEVYRREALSGSREKLQASAMRVSSGYSYYPDPGKPPFRYEGFCTEGSSTPCATPISGYYGGGFWGPTMVMVSVWV